MLKHLLLGAALINSAAVAAQDVVEYRYWWNDDVSTLTTATLTPDAVADVTTALTVPANAGTRGRITVQFKDSNGDYSAPITSSFTRTGKDITGHEFWIDDAVDDRVTGTLGPVQVADLIAALPTGTTSGTHTITIRFRDVDGSWSVPLIAAFDYFTSIDELPGVQDVVLFPNPVDEQLDLRLTSATARELHLTVLDAAGRSAQPGRMWSVLGTAGTAWDLGGLAPGTYILRIAEDDRIVTLPFVKR